MSKRLLITGGAGFIGSALIKELCDDNYEVHVIDDLSFGSLRFVDNSKFEFHKCDILDKKKLISIFMNIRPQVVIHLAAIHFIPYCNLNPFESSNINILGTINVLDACKKSQTVGKLLFASTAAVYPISEIALAETVACSPSDIYGLTKVAGEELVNNFSIQTQIPSISCRFFNAFGPNETNPHLIPEIHAQIEKGDRILKLGNLEPKRDYIHTSDMANAMGQLLKKFDTGYDVFNIGSGIEYSVKEVVHAFEAALGEEIAIVVDPAKKRKVDRLHLLADINKLKNFISWHPRISLETGVSKLLAETIVNG